MYLPTLFKRASDGKRINKWVIEIEGNKYRTISGFEGMAQTTTEWSIAKEKSYCTAAEQALKEATSIHTKRKDKGYFENIDEIDDKKYFEPMLAKVWQDRKHKTSYPVYTQAKLDGIRCIITKDGMKSRNGKDIPSCPHIFQDLKPLFEQDPTLVLDGELYADKFASDFNAITSIVKKLKPTQEEVEFAEKNIEYHIYDVPVSQGSTTRLFKSREVELSNLNLPKSCRSVMSELCLSEKEVDYQYERMMELGYEGLIIRTNSVYENKRTNSLLKYKETTTEEFEIMDVVEGEGNRRGMVGHMKFYNKDGKVFKSNVKADWEKLTQLWNRRDELIGKQATIKYSNLTPQGIPRFPYIIEIDRWSYE